MPYVDTGPVRGSRDQKHGFGGLGRKHAVRCSARGFDKVLQRHAKGLSGRKNLNPGDERPLVSRKARGGTKTVCRGACRCENSDPEAELIAADCKDRGER